MLLSVVPPEESYSPGADCRPFILLLLLLLLLILLPFVHVDVSLTMLPPGSSAGDETLTTMSCGDRDNADGTFVADGGVDDVDVVAWP